MKCHKYDFKEFMYSIYLHYYFWNMIDSCHSKYFRAKSRVIHNESR